MAIELIPLATARLRVGAATVIADAPGGTRMIVPILDATWTGERLNASQVGGAPSADWAFTTADGVNKVDVRSTLQTSDGALIQVTYYGRTIMRDGALILYAAPTFETGHADYRWLNSVLAVARGTLVHDGDEVIVSYVVFEAV